MEFHELAHSSLKLQVFVTGGTKLMVFVTGGTKLMVFVTGGTKLQVFVTGGTKLMVFVTGVTNRGPPRERQTQGSIPAGAVGIIPGRAIPVT